MFFFYNDNGTTPFQSPHNPTEAEFLAVEKLSDLPVLDSEYDLISEEIEEALLDINDWDKLSNNPNVVVKELYVIHNFNKAVVRYYVGNLIQGEFYVRSMISMSFMPNRIFLEKIDGRWEIIRTWEPA